MSSADRIILPSDVEIDPAQRPFVVIDPRAGRGPGIGGIRADSEIGVAMKAGTRATSSASYRNRCRDRLSSASRTPRRCSSRRQARRDRQLPGRLGRHDPGVTAA
jgi:hypothetical protein